MMGYQKNPQSKLFHYGLNLEQRVPQDHILRKIKKKIDFNFIYKEVKVYLFFDLPSCRSTCRELEDMKFDVIDPGFRIQYVPDREALEACYELGRKIGKAVNG